MIVCSIENLDPMGTHTGDSVTVAPQMTLSDEAYQELRDASIRIIRAVGVECGGSNIQFARDRDTGEIRVIEMNPRVSRSSALASKATGYPIAKVAAKLAVGYTLDEIPNDLTKTTPASFEPTLDYVVVKFPRFAFEKFPGADTTLGTQMKSVGEAMGIGRTFTEAFLKAMRSRELDKNVSAPWASLDDVPEDVHPWFKREFDRIGQALWKVALARQARRRPVARAEAARPVRRGRGRRGRRRPRRRRARTAAASASSACSAASTPAPARSRLRRTTTSRPGARPTRRRPSRERESVVILGSGPNRIGQGIEFDYCCVHAAQSFRALGYDAVMVNCNPETVSTDYDTSDRLYFEPLVGGGGARDLRARAAGRRRDPVRRPDAAQAGARARGGGFKIMGTPFDAVDLAEDRERFGELLRELGDPLPGLGDGRDAGRGDRGRRADRLPRARAPVLRARRPRDARLLRRARTSSRPSRRRRAASSSTASSRTRSRSTSTRSPTATTTYVGAVMQHVEEAGVHSGDSSCVLPAPSLTPRPRVEVADDGAPPRAGARRRRPPERPARRRRRAGVRPRGQPARVADGAVREQGDRRQPGAGRVPARRRRDARATSSCPPSASRAR